MILFHSIAINVIRITYVRIAYVFHVILLAQKVAIVETTTDAIVKVAVDIEASTSGSASTSAASSRTSSRVGSRRVSTNAPPTPPRKRAYARAKLFALDDRTAHIAVLDARGVLHIWGASLGTKTVEMAINIAAPPASPSTASVRRSVNIRSSQNVTDAVKGVWAHAPPSQLVWLGVSTGGGAVSCSVLLTEACTLFLFSFTTLLTLSFAFSSLSLVALSLSLFLSLFVYACSLQSQLCGRRRTASSSLSISLETANGSTSPARGVKPHRALHAPPPRMDLQQRASFP